MVGISPYPVKYNQVLNIARQGWITLFTNNAIIRLFRAL